MIEEYYNGTIKSEIIKTAEGTQQRISSETDKNLRLSTRQSQALDVSTKMQIDSYRQATKLVLRG